MRTGKKMTNKEFREALETIGLIDKNAGEDKRRRTELDLNRAAKLLGISRRAAYYYAYGGSDRNIPVPVAQLLRLLALIAKMPPSLRERYELPVEF